MAQLPVHVPLQDVTKDSEDLGQDPKPSHLVGALEDVSPIRKDQDNEPNGHSEYPALDTSGELDLALEDDEMLELNIQLDEVQERKLRRRIEHKRRKASQSISSAGNAFNLSRELSMEIERDRNAQYQEMASKNRELNKELAEMKNDLSNIQRATLSHAREEMQAEVEIFKNSLQSQFAIELNKRLREDREQAIVASDIEARTIIEVNRKEAEHEIRALTKQYDDEIHQLNAVASQAIVAKERESSELKAFIEKQARAEGHESSEVHILRNQLHESYQRLLHESALAQNQAHHIRGMEKIANEAHEHTMSVSENVSNRAAMEVNLVRQQMATLRDESQREISELRAQCTAYEIRVAKFHVEMNEMCQTRVQTLLGEIESKHQQTLALRDEHAKANVDDIVNKHQQELALKEEQHALEVQSLQREIVEVRDEMQGKIISYELTIEEIRKERDIWVQKLHSEVSECRVTAENETSMMKREISNLRQTIASLSKHLANGSSANGTSRSNAGSSQANASQENREVHQHAADHNRTRNDPDPNPDDGDDDDGNDDGDYDEGDYYDEDGYYDDDGEWVDGNDEEQDAPTENNAERPGTTEQSMQGMFTAFMKFMANAQDSEGGKTKEADSIKLPQLPTSAQFKAWKNSVRSKVSAASKFPKEAFDWIIAVEADDVTYDALSTTPAKFETLDAKLSAALTEICKGELGRKITLKTEEEAKARRLIRGRQILWLVYEDYRLNEEAGALHEITDLMKVTLRKDQNKIEHLSRFMLNWEMILAGMKEPPPENQLQILFYEQVRYLPFLNNDIAVYERANIGSEDRSYQFLLKAVKRVLERNKQEKNRKDIERSLESLTAGGKVNALKGKGGKGKGKGKNGKGKGKDGGKGKDNNCREWMRSGSCPRGKDCVWEHPTVDGWNFVQNPKAKAKAKGKPKGKGGKGGRKGKPPGNKEQEAAPPVAAVEDAQNKPAAKGKAKAKSAPKASEPGN